MKTHIWLFLGFLIASGCSQRSKILYQIDDFTVYSDKVIQGKNIASVISLTEIESNYKSLENQNYSRLIIFKCSINEKDNERAVGADHWLIIGDGHESPIIKFGQEDAPFPGDPGTKLPPNYKYTFRIDMSPVFNQFNEKGFYEAFDGTRVAKEDFQAVFLAGGSKPLTWDFSNLSENNLALSDPDENGIYELTVVLNPLDVNTQEIKTWKLATDVSAKPSYHSDQKIVDALYNLSLEEASKNIEHDSTLRTGAKWGGVWTRDVSYSIYLAFAYHEPEVAKISLLHKVNRKRIVQDTGSGGAWPVSSDRVIWANAAWELYKITGDLDWLKQAYEIIKNTLDDDFKTLYSTSTDMFKGESSFLDWREQTYPKWMSNVDIAESENLGTNVAHYRAYMVLVEMAKILGEPYEVYKMRAQKIKNGINNHLWMSNKGYYGQYLYGRSSNLLSPRFEALGEALAIIFEVADSSQAASIISKSPVTPFGVTCIYPQIPGIPPYHNNAIWPFVQSYWNLATAKVGNEKMLNHGLASIYRAGALFLTNYENFVAQNGDYLGTEINSDRMLWSMAGNLAMVHRIFMGMNFEPDGIRFHPIIPKTYNGTKKLTDFRYRKAKLNMTVSGFGNQIASITLDGESLKDAFFPGSMTGDHEINIQMVNYPMEQGIFYLVENKFSLPNPQVQLLTNLLQWETVEGATQYNIYRNGTFWNATQNTFISIDSTHLGEYAVTALDTGSAESFSCEPILVYQSSNEHHLETENYATKSNLPYTNYSGEGFVEITQNKNRQISIPIQVEHDGSYLLSFRYANGTGPWNTGNNCGIRSLYVNDSYQGVIVFPQRGANEWSDWGFTNVCKVQLIKGENNIKLKFEEWNTNMDGEINDALIDYLQIIEII